MSFSFPPLLTRNAAERADDHADGQGDDAHLVATLFRQHKKASSTSKIYSLYLIDAIAREARSLAKKAAKDLSLQDAGYSTFIAKLEAILSKLVVDCWENGKLEHRVSSATWLLDGEAQARGRVSSSSCFPRRARGGPHSFGAAALGYTR